MVDNRKSDQCCVIEDRLIDYADGVLRGAEAAEVRHHVDQCVSCRREIATLQQSLVHARSVWRESTVHLSAHRVSKARQRLQPFAWFVVGTAVFAVVMLGWSMRKKRTDPAMVSQAMFDIEDVDAYLQREEQIARLTMSARILADVPNSDDDVARATKFLERVYGVSISDTMIHKPPLQQGT